MPVTSFVMGAEGWTPIDHKQTTAPRPLRLVPVGPIHAVDPEARSAICSGNAMVVDAAGRSFVAWGPGTCPACSEAIAPGEAGGPDPAWPRP